MSCWFSFRFRHGPALWLQHCMQFPKLSGRERPQIFPLTLTVKNRLLKRSGLQRCEGVRYWCAGTVHGSRPRTSRFCGHYCTARRRPESRDLSCWGLFLVRVAAVGVMSRFGGGQKRVLRGSVYFPCEGGGQVRGGSEGGNETMLRSNKELNLLPKSHLPLPVAVRLERPCTYAFPPINLCSHLHSNMCSNKWEFMRPHHHRKQPFQ